MMNHNNDIVRIFSAVSVAICFSAGVQVANAAELNSSIRLLDQAGCQTQQVRLVDIAELQGDYALSLADTVIAAFKHHNDRQLNITLDDIRNVLSSDDVNWARLSLRGYTNCQVNQMIVEQELEPENEVAVVSNLETEVGLETSVTLKDRILALVQRELDIDQSDLQLTYSTRDENLVLRNIMTGQYELEPVLGVRVGRIPITIRRYENGRIEETFTVTTEVKRRALVVVATATISRGSLFNSDNIKVTEVWLDNDRGEPIEDPELIKGQMASTVLRQDTVIYPEHVRSPLLIKRGELVTVRCFSGVLVVRTVAKAMEDGALDEMIQVRNENTRETFSAIVTGRRQAVVQLDRLDGHVELSSAITGDSD